jgi:hypothetical protein
MSVLSAYVLPEWLDAESLRQASVVAMFVLGIIGLIVWRVVRAVVTKMIYLGLIAALIGGLWLQRDDLEECQTTCSCSLFGQDVAIPDARLPSILDAGEGDAFALCHQPEASN